ncbi:GIY-YIG nuclease family protein [Roseivirga sp. E12]|uniref:GIY-YIG nuclease family protein n=1 Tax=Roseivirga sp. E12 TaxID=2819237 RepID=UPI001ABC252D|nr:GIY-YIG nuclease family protein [Roseivirga sp. E12]
MPQYSVYILFSPSINRFYIGYTSDFEGRFRFHNDLLRNHIWTKRGQPWERHLLTEELSKSQALRIERHIKGMKSRKYIQKLAQSKTSIIQLKRKFA